MPGHIIMKAREIPSRIHLTSLDVNTAAVERQRNIITSYFVNVMNSVGNMARVN